MQVKEYLKLHYDRILTGFFIFILILGLITASLYTFIHYPRISYKLVGDPRVQKTIYTFGEDLFWTVSICKLHDQRLYSQRFLQNLETNREYLIPEVGTGGDIKKGECHVGNPNLIIPQVGNIDSGTYRLHVRVTILDPWRNYKPFEYYTNEFKIE